MKCVMQDQKKDHQEANEIFNFFFEVTGLNTVIKHCINYTEN